MITDQVGRKLVYEKDEPQAKRETNRILYVGSVLAIIALLVVFSWTRETPIHTSFLAMIQSAGSMVKGDAAVPAGVEDFWQVPSESPGAGMTTSKIYQNLRAARAYSTARMLFL